MTQPPKPQTKFNAKRSAENATRRTGIEHSIAEVEGGWMVVAPAAAATGEPVATGIDEAIQAEASAIADEIDAGQVKPPGSPPRVPRGHLRSRTSRPISPGSSARRPRAVRSAAIAPRSVSSATLRLTSNPRRWASCTLCISAIR